MAAICSSPRMFAVSSERGTCTEMHVALQEPGERDRLVSRIPDLLVVDERVVDDHR